VMFFYKIAKAKVGIFPHLPPPAPLNYHNGMLRENKKFLQELKTNNFSENKYKKDVKNTYLCPR